ncbi:MAG TPA: cytochrome c [Steroidobacteraceae bacterium]|nr:cytochrome c [Steroidobacteraceae bacterium]
MKRLQNMSRVAVAVSAVAISALALAQTGGVAKTEAEAKTAIEARQQVFKDIKKANEPLQDMLKNKREIDAAVIKANAGELQKLAPKIPPAFALDTRAFKDIKTRAQDGIWSSQADFAAKADAFAKAAANVAAMADSGDKGAIKKAIADMGKSCGACHDNYQVKL